MKLLLLFALVATARCATIQTSATAITKPAYGSPAPDCFVSDASSATCNFNGAGADASASGWFDEAHSQAGVYVATFADRVAGQEQAIAEAQATLDAFFVPSFTGVLTGIYSFARGPGWGSPPELTIIQGSNMCSWGYNNMAEPTNCIFAWIYYGSEIAITSQVEAGVLLEVRISIADRVSAPLGAGTGQAQLFEFQDASGNRITLPDPPSPSSVPEPNTFTFSLIGLILLRGASLFLGSARRARPKPIPCAPRQRLPRPCRKTTAPRRCLTQRAPACHESILPESTYE